MPLWELFLIGVGLAADAFAVAICKGLSVEKVRLKHALITGAWFGGFQMLMPVTDLMVFTASSVLTILRSGAVPKTLMPSTPMFFSFAQSASIP